VKDVRRRDESQIDIVVIDLGYLYQRRTGSEETTQSSCSIYHRIDYRTNFDQPSALEGCQRGTVIPGCHGAATDNSNSYQLRAPLFVGIFL
jgi:hypothetical protein